MANQYEVQLRADWEKFSKTEFLPNIMLLGATGCGKSSLVNLIFGKEIAPVNDVSRGTDGFKTYYGADHDIGVNLIDSRGYELENGEDTFENYRQSIIEKMEESRNKDPKGKIHIIWFCISVAVGRIQDYDIEILKLLRNEPELRNRVAVVLTKCDEDDENGSVAKKLRRIISAEIGENVQVFEVSNDESLVQELDLDKLIEWSAEQLDDEDMKDAFLATQMIGLHEKRKRARKAITGYAATAATIGATPIPFSDAPLLTTLQVTMSAHIIRIYGMENFASISKAVIGNVVVSNLGKSLASGLIKLIPGIGTIAGGFINAAVASLITSALGFAISEICYNCCKKLACGESVDFDNLFSLEAVQNLTQVYMDKHKDDLKKSIEK